MGTMPFQLFIWEVPGLTVQLEPTALCDPSGQLDFPSQISSQGVSSSSQEGYSLLPTEIYCYILGVLVDTGLCFSS